ncbi:hypothetical protein RJ45_08800 [Photobacterium gaetbulicola]|uniref:Methyltransferase type 12 domain-containing protein n=1 Tax=Photobacterium gaetbulicola TaxID=1295392 RepID=A0A0B9G5U4_9GAMM|nr:class I SAM-dependent methyltransferase [Photobacterium gaetbulicola]KHT63999.1 hypothetical protein RJ45_08800 [Photobacterium gaetbulicola]
MLSKNKSKENLTNYIDAMSGVETITAHLIAHAFKLLGVCEDKDVDYLSLPVIDSKKDLFLACISILEKEGLLLTENAEGCYRFRAGSIMSMKALAEFKAGLTERCPAIEGHIALLLQCAKSLSSVIAGKVDGLQVLFPQGSSDWVAATYQGNALQDDLSEEVARQVIVALGKQTAPDYVPKALEIGAGTCATTRRVMKAMALSGVSAELHVTDIALALVNDAERSLAEPYPFASFMVLDIEDPDCDKLAAIGQYDVIYAANVLHATSSIRPVINNIVKLLRPGGVVIINELTAFSIFATVTFGLTDGWWLFKDDKRIEYSPLISSNVWEELLREAGFNEVYHYFPESEQGNYTRQSVISSHLDGNR